MEPLWYESCWRCRCAIPNGLVRRRVVQTGVSRDPRGYEIAHYGPVSVCGPCDTELAEQARRQLQEAAARRREVLQLIGVLLSSVFCSVSLDIPLAMTFILFAALFWLRLWWQTMSGFLALRWFMNDLHVVVTRQHLRWLLGSMVALGVCWRCCARYVLPVLRYASADRQTSKPIEGRQHDSIAGERKKSWLKKERRTE